jgi:2-haloacid dehalogenase
MPILNQKGPFNVSIKAVVFDAYGTLFDTQSVASITGGAFPGHGELITQIWRIKQLEYTWHRSLMRRYEDFSVVTRDSLVYTLRTLGLTYDAGVFERVMDKYLHLDLYDDVRQALAGLKDYKLAILSNGSTEMLTTLVRNTGLDKVLDATISIDAKRVFKPSPEAYALVETHLGVAPAEVFFVSSNPWDAIGAKAFGFKTAWIERVTPKAMAEAFERGGLISPRTMFMALRMQIDELGLVPDYRVHGLSPLVGLLASSVGQGGSSDSA